MSIPERGPANMQSLLGGLNEAIRENPVGAGVIGMGVLWMLLGNRRIGSIGGAIPGAIGSAAGSVGSAAAAGGHSVASGFGTAGTHIRDASQRVREGLSDHLAPQNEEYPPQAEPTRLDAADVEEGNLNANAAVTERAKAIGETARVYAHSGLEYGASLKDKLADRLERQPLLLGVLGLAIGAGIASAFPSTQIESELMGEQSAAAREKVHGTTEDLKATAKQVLEDVKQEAQAQGLTLDAAKDTLKEVGDRAKKVAASNLGD
jgi:hypothetical protein